jgi:hypothetical protein
MGYHRAVIVGLVFTVAGGIWLVQMQRLRREQSALLRDQRSVTEMEGEMQGAKEVLAGVEGTLQEEQRQRDLVMAKVHETSRQLQEIDPDSYWATPPATWPLWDSASPYVWLSKETLAKMPVPVFEKSGRLPAEAGAVLALAPEQIRELNGRLGALMAGYREQLMRKAEAVEPPFPEYSEDKPQAAVQLAPDPGLAAAYRETFESEVRGVTGEQRGDLILKIADRWLGGEFSVSGEPKIYAAARHEDGSYNVKIQQGGNHYLSVGGVRNLRDYIPEALLPWFRQELGE